MQLTRFRLIPPFFGCISCIMLIISFIISDYLPNDMKSQAVNTILVIAIMCTSIHLVRTTAALNHSHVWNDTPLVILWFIPVFNLFIIALQFFGGIFLKIFTGYFFTAIMIFLSLPVFFCLYFLYVSKKLFNNRLLYGISLFSALISVLYVIFRLMDKIIFPLLEETGVMINSILRNISMLNSQFSLFLYIIYFFGFILLCYLMKKDKILLDK